MEIQFIAGFGPIGTDGPTLRGFWGEVMGIDLTEMGPDYYHATRLDGAKVFGLWPLPQAAEATFGSATWPDHLPVPQAWIEFEVASPQAVADGATELAAKGQTILSGPLTEPWGQTTARLLSPEGMLVGLSYMPPFHADDAE